MHKHIEIRKPKTYQMDRHGLLRPIMLMNELQAVADTHAEDLDRGRTYCMDKNCAWVVTHYLIEINEMPGEGQEIEISTWPSGRDAVRAIRDFRITDVATGRELVRATSQWILIDAAARRPLRLDDIMSGWGIISERALDRTFDKFPDFDADVSMAALLRFDDIDLNQHINNAVYAVWATEALGFEFRNAHKLRGLSINFKKEIPAGVPAVTVESKLDGATSRHIIKSNEEINAVMICEWEKISDF
ncbi:MAG: thioesterase [Alphaproteobacteria bacterium]|nr:thioesterase [Alphaproteobacteria bacterium]MCL2889668.1 thioesterase [Alphaproteobacteria bacterium]